MSYMTYLYYILYNILYTQCFMLCNEQKNYDIYHIDIPTFQMRKQSNFNLLLIHSYSVLNFKLYLDIQWEL